MILFLIKSTICLLVLYAFYVLFLENKKMHQFNRFYLIGILIISLVIPAININSESSIVYSTTKLIGSISLLHISNYALLLYFLITVGLLFKFSLKLYSILKLIKNNLKVKQNNKTLILLEDKVLPHTFLKFIFLNKNDYENGTIQDELFTHELTHVTEKHTIDILFIELFQIIFWFNPFLTFINKSIRLNHEFIADDIVINTHKDRSNYQHILLGISSWNNTNHLTSNLNYSLTKQRFMMMVNNTPQLSIRLVKLSILPLLIVLVLIFGNTSYKSEHGLDNTTSTNSEHTYVSEHSDYFPNNEHSN